MKTFLRALLLICGLLLPTSTPSAAGSEKGKDTLDRALEAVALNRADLRVRADLSSNPFALARFGRWMETPLQAPSEAQEKALQLLAAAGGDPAYWFARLAECGDIPEPHPLPAGRSPENRVPEGLPPPLRKALLLLLSAMESANSTLSSMQQALRPDEKAGIARSLYPEWVAGDRSRDGMEEGSRTDRVREALRMAGDLDRRALASATHTLLTALGKAANLLSGPEMKGIDLPSFSFPTGVGLVKVGGRGPDTHDEGAALIIDLGGDDLYRGAVASGRDGRSSLVLDLEGNDTYLGEDFTQGSGFWGVGILLDRKGNDLYRAGNACQGAGLFGVGLLIDEEGSDRYLGGQFAQAASSWGWGGLIDRSGEDLYQCRASGQAFSGVLGVSCLCDLGGNDRYVSGLDSPDPREPDMNQSFSQGFSMGLRDFAAGGFALLADRAGNDFYQCQYFGQGSSYWMGIGILYDHEGNDTYLARRYAQGAGIHFSLGMLLDAGGNDQTCSWGVSQGCGHDYGIGILINQAGNDSYASDWLSMGASEANGIGLFVDSGGDDGYDTRSGMGVGHLTPSRRAGGIGIFMDVGGTDRYAGKGAEDSLWAVNRFGVAVDDPGGHLTGLRILSSETSAPAEDPIANRKSSERARLRRILDRNRGTSPAGDVEALLSAASHWGLEQELPEIAKERLLRMDPRVSVPAMARLLDVRDIMSLLFMEKFFTVHAFHALPYLMDKAKDPDPAVQAAAFSFLARIRDTRALDCALSATASPSWRVRAWAARALGEMLDRERLTRLIPIRNHLGQLPGKQAPRTVQGFLSKEMIAWVLSVLVRSSPIGYETYRRFTDSALPPDGEGWREEWIGLVDQHLGEAIPLVDRWIKDIEDSLHTGAILMKCLEDTDPSVRRSAAYALGQLRFEPALQGLVALLHDSDRWVRDGAVLSLALFGDQAVPHLNRALEGGDPFLTILALDALAGIKTETAGALIRRLRDHPNENVRRTVTRLLSSN